MTTRLELNPLYVQKIEKRIALMQAHLAGKEIELQDVRSPTGSWITIEIGVSLEWDFSRFEYRIKIETCVPYRRYLFKPLQSDTAKNNAVIGFTYQNDSFPPEGDSRFIRWIDTEFQTHPIQS